MGQNNTITDETQTFEQELDEMQAESDEATNDALAQWAEGSESQEGAPESPPSDAELPPEKPAEKPAEPSDELATANTEISRLTREAEDQKAQAETARLATSVRLETDRYARELVSSGWSEEQAKAQADSEGRAYLAEQRVTQMQDQSLARELSYSARELSRIHGVPEASLTVYSTVEQMTAAATQLGPNARKITALETQMTEMKKSGVPVQQYSQRASSKGVATESQNLDAYNDGSRTPEATAAAKRALGLG